MIKNKPKEFRKLKALRVEFGYTQESMARKLGMSENGYLLKENGKREFTLTEAERIARLFNKTITEVFY